ncbi:MAG: hypothetical protein QGG40_21965, partial [Myxococcota bacterium]|nr:hypothetical protein [Myxococcota bacterium]
MTGRRDWMVLALVALGVQLVVHLPQLLDPLSFYPDMVHDYALVEIVDPGRYLGDPIREATTPWMQHPGYRLAVAPFVGLLGVQRGLELVALLLGVAVPVVGFAAVRPRGPWASWSLGVALLALAVVLDSVHGGKPRAFGLLLTVGLAASLVRARADWAIACIPVGVLLYPVVLPPTVLTVCTWL